VSESEAREDDGLPVFARKFPDDPALAPLVAAFREGNYAKVRRDAPAVAKSEASDEVKSAARELVRRTQADPMMIGLLVVTGVLLVFLTLYWEMRK
jgi:hypothetical protein